MKTEDNALTMNRVNRNHACKAHDILPLTMHSFIGVKR